MATAVSAGGGAKRRPVNRPFCLCRVWLTSDPHQPKRETQSSCSRDYLCLLALSSVQVVNFHHFRHSQPITPTGMPPSKDDAYFSSWTHAHFPAVATVITPELQATHNLEFPLNTPPPLPPPRQTDSQPVSQSVWLAGWLAVYEVAASEKRRHVPK